MPLSSQAQTKPVPSELFHIPLLNFSLELIEGTLLFEDFYLPIIALIAWSRVYMHTQNISSQISLRELHLCTFAISVHASSHERASIQYSNSNSFFDMILPPCIHTCQTWIVEFPWLTITKPFEGFSIASQV